jgi:hypothetical protein
MASRLSDGAVVFSHKGLFRRPVVSDTACPRADFHRRLRKIWKVRPNTPAREKLSC